jgi:hypothetical protein
MSTKRIEILAERRASLQDPKKSLRVLRHLDAARVKLEILQVTRRQLKIDLKKSAGERDAALADIEELKLQYDKQSHEFHDVQALLEAQAEQITQLRVECTKLQDSVGRRQRPRQRDEDGPALTVLALEKVAAQISATNAAITPAEQPSASTKLMDRILSHIRPGISKTP